MTIDRVPGSDSAAGGRAPWALRSLYLASGTWTASIAPFMTVILHSHGIDTFTIGLLSALAALAATALVPGWGHLADVLVGRAFAFRIGVVITAGAAIVLLLPLPLLLLAAILASVTIFPPMFLALGDALAMSELPAPERQYGALRSLASLSFAVGVIVVGFVYDRAGYGAAPMVSLLCAGLLFLLIGWVPDRTRDARVRAVAGRHGGDAAAGRFGSVSRALSVQPRLWGVLAVFTVAYAGSTGAIVFVGIRLVELGGQPSDVALSFGLAAFAEIPGLVMAAWIGRRIGIRWLVVLALIAYGVCIASWGILPTPVAINATRVITGVLFGALSAARVVIIARLLPDELQATGQSMMQATTAGLSTAVGAVLGGAMYGGLGPPAFFGFAGALSIVGGMGAWFALHGSVGDRAGADASWISAPAEVPR